MPVVIHEMEVVPQSGPGAAGSSTGSQPSQPEPGRSVGARDVVRIERHMRERALRVWAH